MVSHASLNKTACRRRLPSAGGEGLHKRRQGFPRRRGLSVSSRHACVREWDRINMDNVTDSREDVRGRLKEPAIPASGTGGNPRGSPPVRWESPARIELSAVFRQYDPPAEAMRFRTAGRLRRSRARSGSPRSRRRRRTAANRPLSVHAPAPPSVAGSRRRR